MANPGYVRSTDGSDGDNGSTWALANATAAGAITDASAGDRIWFSNNHAESTAGAVTLVFPGTFAAPNQLLCGDDAAEPPTALATTGSIATTGANSLTVAGNLYAYGLILSCGSGASTVTLGLINGDSNWQVWDSCALRVAATGGASRLRIGPSSGGVEGACELINCTLKFGNTAQGLNIGWATVTVRGGGLDGAGSAITTFVATATATGFGGLLVDGFDFSAGAAALNLIASGCAAPGKFIFRNCKLPASWSGLLFAGAPTHFGVRAEMYNCSASDTNYGLWVEDLAGSIKHETTLVLTGGASDGTTTISWKMATTANAEYPLIVLRSPEFYAWVDSTGSALTATVEILYDGVTALTDADVWLEVEYLGTSGFPLGGFADDCKADVLANAADQTASSATWSGIGSPTPLTQKLVATFTPQEKGVLICRVCLAKASTTVYVNPKAAVA